MTLLHLSPFDGPTWGGAASGATLGLALRVSSPQPSLAGATGHLWDREGNRHSAALTPFWATWHSLSLCHQRGTWEEQWDGGMEGCRKGRNGGMGWRRGLRRG